MKRKFTYKRSLVYFRKWNNKRYSAFNSCKRVIKICTLAVAYSIVSKPEHVKAQGLDTTTTKVYELDDVVVQSTLIELKNASTGRSIEVINGNQLQTLPVTTVEELLRYVPGVEARQRGGFGSQTDFSLRGSNFNQVIVLIDGLKINDPVTAHFNGNLPITSSEIDKIEIIRGPASVEYGPDAIGGVINIITKTFSRNREDNTLSSNFKINTGQYGLINADGGVFLGNDKFRISAGGLINKSDGNPLSSGLKGFFDIKTFSFSPRYQLNNKWSAAYRYAKDYRYFNAQWFYTTYASDKAVEKVNRERHQFELDRNGINSATKVQASYINTDDYYLYTPGVKPNNNNSYLGEVIATHSFRRNLISALLGSSIQQRKVVSYDRGNHSINQYAAFSTFSFSPNQKTTLNSGLRFNYDEKYGGFLLPQAGFSYKLSKTALLRASAGRSVRTPDFTESFSNNFRNDTLKPGNSLGNPELKVEKSWNAELGFDLKMLQKQVLFSSTAFYRRSNGIIDYVRTDATDIPVHTVTFLPTSYFWFARNNSSGKTYGLENRFSYRKDFSKQNNIVITCGYTFFHQNELFDKPARYSSLTPKHLFNTELITQMGLIKLSVNGLYKIRKSMWSQDIQRYFKRSYSVWNADIDIAVFKKNAFVSIVVYNIFDQNYSDFIGAEMPGRWIAGGIKLKL